MGVKSQEGCSTAEESVLQNEVGEVADDEAMQGPVHTLKSWSSPKSKRPQLLGYKQVG